jgi:sialic acid synthase SpsE
LAMTTSKDATPTRAAMTAAFESVIGKNAIAERVTLLHCTTDYPTKPVDVNLNAMLTLRNRFNCQVGFSDHSVGVHLAVAAVAMGATIIEKHLTTSRTLPGPDHKASLEPDEFKILVNQIRELQDALGNGQKLPTKAEIQNKNIARRSIVAARQIKTGEVFTKDNIVIKRPGTGRSPIEYWSLLNTKATRDIAENEII